MRLHGISFLVFSFWSSPSAFTSELYSPDTAVILDFCPLQIPAKLHQINKLKAMEGLARAMRQSCFHTLQDVPLLLRRASRSRCHCAPRQGSISKIPRSLFLLLCPAETNEISWPSGVFRIYNLNFLPHARCCYLRDEQQPASCSLLHPRLMMCQIPGIMKWQCTPQITLENNRDFPCLLAHPGTQTLVEQEILSLLK